MLLIYFIVFYQQPNFQQYCQVQGVRRMLVVNTRLINIQTSHNKPVIFILLFMINLDHIGPDWELAEAHSKATCPGKLNGDFQKVIRCPCCFQAIDKNPIGICSNAKQLQCLGFGFPLYFKFLKYAIIMVVLQAAIYNTVAVYWSYKDNIPFCHDHKPKQLSSVTSIQHCTGIFVSLSRIQYHIDESETILRISSFIVQLLVLIYIRDKMGKANAYYDEITTSLSDYSLIVKDLPLVTGVQDKIRTMFKTFFSQPIELEQLVVIGHLKEYYSIEHEKQLLTQEKLKIMGQLQKKPQLSERMETLDFEIAQNQKFREQQIQKEFTEASKDTLLCQKVIITLSSDPIKQIILDEFQANMKDQQKKEKLRNIFQDENIHNIKILQAPQPNQIIWEHINIERRQRLTRQTVGWLLTFLIISVFTVAIYFLLQLKSQVLEHYIEASKKNESTANTLLIQALVLVYGFIFLIIFVNKFVIAPLLHHIAHYQRHPSLDKEEYSFSLKYTLCLFFTTALMTLLVEDITLHNIYSHDYGVVEEESIMFFVNALFVPILWLINPWHLFRVIRRKMKYGKTDLTQKQANQIMQNMPISIGKLYGQIIETIWFTYFYASIIPIGAVLTIVGLSLHYWVDKYNLLRRSSLDRQTSGKMCLKALKLLDISLIMRPIGSLIFDFQIKDRYTIQSIVCSIVAIIYILLPMDRILQKVHGEEFRLQSTPYSEVKHKFIRNYKTLHPIISQKKLFVQSELKNLQFQQVHQTVRKKLSKKISTVIQMTSLSTSKTISSSGKSIRQVLI